MIINRYAKGGGLSPRIVVTATTGSTVTCTKGGTTLTATEVSGKWTFNLNDFGTWTVNATLGGKSATKDVDVVWAQVYEVTLLFADATLNNNDWETIKQVADASEGQNYWAVGDTKQITINGKLSDGLTLSNYSTYVYIIGFDHNKDVEGTGIAFQGFKTAQTGGIDIALCDSGYHNGKSSGQWFNMNNNYGTSGGWNGCGMRNNTLPVVKATLPTELTSVIKMTSIYTDNTGGSNTSPSYVTTTKDELYLLAEYEIFGARTYANIAEQNYQQQYAYYVAGNSKVKHKHDSAATAVNWWERSVQIEHNNFCYVEASGRASYDGAGSSEGLAPAFKVGTTPIFPTLNDNSWSAIAKVAYTSEGANYWSVGDTKEVVLNGTGVSNVDFVYYNTWVYILGFDHNEDIEGKGIVFGGFKTAQTGGVDVALCDSKYGIAHSAGQWFNINNTNSNAGGWASSRMRSNVLQDIKNSLPSDLTSVIKTSTIYTDNTGGGSDVSSYVTATQDDLYLLAEYEIFGAHDYANSAEQNYQQQYEYYSSGGRSKKIKYRYNSTLSAAYWWERSLRATTNYEWTYVSTDGYQTGGNCDMSFGLAPAFRVCYTPPRLVTAGSLSVGSTVKVYENSTLVDYIVVQQGNPDASIYDSSCDGTWLLRKDIYANGRYNSNNIASYPNSTIDTSLNGGFLNSLSIKDTIKQIKIPYAISNYSSSIKVGADGHSTKVFPLSLPELGFRTSDYSGVVADGAKLSYFEYGTDTSAKNLRISNNQGWWTRDPIPNEYAGVSYVDSYGGRSGVTANDSSYGYKPAFIIPSDTIVGDGIVGGGSNVSV